VVYNPKPNEVPLGTTDQKTCRAYGTLWSLKHLSAGLRRWLEDFRRYRGWEHASDNKEAP